MFNGNQIEGVKIKPLKKICDERGAVYHMLKSTDENFTKFGEIYFTCGYPQAVKAWHVHKLMTMNNCCVSGMVKLVIYDCRDNSKTKGNLMEIFLGDENYCIVQIPPGVANGYKAYGNKMSIMANCADMTHDKNELIYIDPFKNDIPYNWDIKHR